MPETIAEIKTARRGWISKDRTSPTKEFGCYLNGSEEHLKIFSKEIDMLIFVFLKDFFECSVKIVLEGD